MKPTHWEIGTLGTPVFVGIDQSLTGFGIAALDDEGNLRADVYRPGNVGTARLVSIRTFLVGFLRSLPELPRQVTMEGYAYGSQKSNSLGELGGLVRVALWDLGITPVVVAPPTLKKFVLSNGTAKKQQMLLGVWRKWGLDFDGDDDATEAYALARIARARVDFAYEAACLKTLGLTVRE